MRGQVPWVAVVLAAVLVVAVGVALLAAAILMLYAGAPPWLVAPAVAALGWVVYAVAQRVRPHQDSES